MASADSGPASRFVQIVKVENERLTLDQHKLKEVITQRSIVSRKLALVCLSGEFGRGKSFLINIFATYLREGGHTNHNWIKFQRVIANRKSTAPDEQGIYVWSDAFIVNEVAVLLMKTQSDYMYEGRRDIPMQIFAFSTLLSSVQVFNLRSQIRGLDLEFLVSFTQLAAKCLARMKERSFEIPPFQKLQFLIRDWQYQSDNKFGPSGGYAYLTDVLQNCKLDTGYESVEIFLSSHFTKTTCFLMPHPGMQDEFNDQLTPLCGSLFHPITIEPKKNLDEQRSILGLAENCAKVVREMHEASSLSAGGTSEKLLKPVSEKIKFFQKAFRKISVNFDAEQSKPSTSAPLSAKPRRKPVVPPRSNLNQVPRSWTSDGATNASRVINSGQTTTPKQTKDTPLNDVFNYETEARLRNMNTDASLFDTDNSTQSENIKPRAVNIVIVSEGKLKLAGDALWEILRHPSIGNKPLSIVSVAGAFRKGKSFILNFFLRYLRNEGYEIKNDDQWMGSLDKPLDDGLEWRGGKTPDTQGILMWNEPFCVRTLSGEVAVLLVDTQGLFDTTTSKDIETQIFAFSTLLSSVQILNLVQQIQENDLDFLQFTTEYAASAESHRKGRRPFQALTFLVRDWPHLCDHAYGWDGGHEYIEGLMERPNNQQDLKSVREHLRANFDSMRCFLMPYPGNAIIKPNFDGRLRCLDKDFTNCLTSLLDDILHKHNLVLKKIDGKVVRARELFDFCSHIFEIFQSGALPTAQSYMEVSADLRNSEARRECLELYTSHMAEKTKTKCLPSDELDEVHQKVKGDIMKIFMAKTEFGGAAKQNQVRELVEDEIDSRLLRFFAANQDNEAALKLKNSDLHAQALAKYKAEMKQMTKSPLPDEEFNNIHQRKFDDAMQICKNVDEALMMEYTKLKEENKQRYQIIKQKKEEELLANNQEKARKKYNDEMTQVCREYMNPKKLKLEHLRVKQEIIREFERTVVTTNLAPISERLDSELEQKGKMFANKNALTEAQYISMLGMIEKNCQEKFLKETKLADMSVHGTKALNIDLSKIRVSTLEGFKDQIPTQYSEIAEPYLDKLITFVDENIQGIESRNRNEIEARREAKAEEEFEKIKQNCLHAYESNMKKRTHAHLFSEEQLRSEHKNEVKVLVGDLRQSAERLGILTNHANIYENFFEDKFDEISSINQKSLRKAKQSLQQQKQHLIYQYKKMMSDATKGGNVEKRKLYETHQEHRDNLVQKLECAFSFQSDYINNVQREIEKEINEVFKAFELNNSEKLKAAEMETTTEADLKRAKMEGISYYQRYILEVSEKYAPPDQLAEVHRYGKKEALSRFDFATKNTVAVKPGVFVDTRNDLEREIELEFQKLKTTNENMKKTILDELISLVRELVEEYVVCMEGKTDQAVLDKEELRLFHDEARSLIIAEFDQRVSSNPEIAHNVRDSLVGGIDDKYSQFVGSNETKCVERRKKEIQRHLLNMFSICFDQYRSTMSECAKEYVSETALNGKHRELRQYALDRYKKETRKYQTELEDLESLLPLENTLKEKIETEYEGIVKSNQEKKKTREYDISLATKGILTSFEEREIEELKLSEVHDEKELESRHHLLIEEAKQELMKIDDTDLSKRCLKMLENDLKEAYEKSAKANAEKISAMKKIKMEEQLLDIVSTCAANFDREIEQFSGLSVKNTLITDKLILWKNQSLSDFDKRSEAIYHDREALRRHRENLRSRLGKAHKAAISENQRNQEHFQLTTTKMQTQSVLMYHVIMDHVLLPGFITEENLRKLHLLVVEEVFEYLDAQDLPIYMGNDKSKRETEEFNMLSMNIKHEIEEVYTEKSKLNKKNHGFFIKAIVAAKENLCNLVNRIGDAELGQFHTRKRRVSTKRILQKVKNAFDG